MKPSPKTQKNKNQFSIDHKNYRLTIGHVHNMTSKVKRKKLERKILDIWGVV